MLLIQSHPVDSFLDKNKRNMKSQYVEHIMTAISYSYDSHFMQL
jgi:hypothetical protein